MTEMVSDIVYTLIQKKKKKSLKNKSINLCSGLYE